MHRLLTTVCGALLAVLATAWSAVPPEEPVRQDAATTVRTHAGLVGGAAHDGYRTFEGIPYAAPRSAGCAGRCPAERHPGPGYEMRPGPRVPARSRPARCPAAAPTRTVST